MTVSGTDRWDAVFDVWRTSPDQSLWRRHSDAVNRALLEAWLPDRVGRILKTDLWDEAVGVGLVPVLEARSAEVVGIDASDRVVDAARARYPGLTAVQADVRHLPFPNGHVDAVVSNSTLDHFDSREQLILALRELRRVLRPGGRLILTLDNPVNPFVALTKAVPRGLLNRAWVRLGGVTARIGLLPYHVGATLGHRSLRDTLAREGFDVRETRPIVHAPRLVAVVAGRATERWAQPDAGERFLRVLFALERLNGWPTRYLTAHFVAALATRRGG